MPCSHLCNHVTRRQKKSKLFLLYEKAFALVVTVLISGARRKYVHEFSAKHAVVFVLKSLREVEMIYRDVRLDSYIKQRNMHESLLCSWTSEDP